MIDLYHYTCRHGAQYIADNGGLLRPRWHPFLRLAGSWATDMPEPDAEALGLTATILACDRTERRFLVLDADAFTWWPDWWPKRVDPRAASLLSHPPHQPARWWIGRKTARVVGA